MLWNEKPSVRPVGVAAANKAMHLTALRAAGDRQDVRCVEKMAQRSIRFGITNGEGRRAATWKLWTETGGGRSEVYLACRSLGGTLKASMHELGNWHIAYSQIAFEKYVEGVFPNKKDRFVKKWSRPTDNISPGITLAFRIVTPWSAVTNYIDESNTKKVQWLNNAPKPKATEIDILFTEPSVRVTGWPGERSMNTSLIGKIPLENGSTVWAVYRVVDMPDLLHVSNKPGRFYKGRSREDVKSEGLRALAFGTETDGSVVLYDCAVEISDNDYQ